MNLILDIGNSNTKVGIFENNTLLFKETLAKDGLYERVKTFKEKYKKIENVIICCVGKLDKDVKDLIESYWSCYELKTNLNFTFKNLYRDKSLGVDRIALIEATKNMLPEKNVLAIDMGTCNTYNLISKKGEFLGGVITNGLSMKYESINKFTKNLPKVDINDNSISILSQTTISNINSGIYTASLYEIRGFIEDYRRIYNDLEVLITGGNSFFFANKIKSAIFANNYFLLEGINIIFKNNFLK